MKVELLEYPGESDWIEVRRRCLVTAEMCEYHGGVCHELNGCGR